MSEQEASLSAGAVLRAVRPDQWPVVAWLWQAFRQDLSPVVHGLPYADGRYGHGPLDPFPSTDGAGWIAWRPHPNTADDAPVGFALVGGLEAPTRSIEAFWVAPPLRRSGLGAAMALAVLGRHPGPWEIGFQHDNPSAGAFWRRVADAAFGDGRWTETRQVVPGRPDAPPDHVVRS